MKNRARNWQRAMCRVAVLALLLAALPTDGAPLFRAEDGGAIVTLHSEPCALKEVINLKHRATWIEKGKVSEGCWGAREGIVLMYFDDKTVAIAPAQAFERVTGT